MCLVRYPNSYFSKWMCSQKRLPQAPGKQMQTESRSMLHTTRPCVWVYNYREKLGSSHMYPAIYLGGQLHIRIWAKSYDLPLWKGVGSISMWSPWDLMKKQLRCSDVHPPIGLAICWHAISAATWAWLRPEMGPEFMAVELRQSHLL